MKTLVFGETGQLARELACYDGVRCLGRDAADLTDASACADAIQSSDADVVINAAAYTAVDAAEADAEAAHKINADAPGAMALACAAKGIPFLHVSTDYVFDGSGTAPWTEADMTGPLGVYGASKLAGERAIEAAGGSHAILRTSWVVSAHGKNFVKTMLALGADRDGLSIVADQVGGPTPARDIAGALMAMAPQLCGDAGKSGIYHFAGQPDASWADFAREIFAQAGVSCAITDIPTSDYPTPAQRPLNSRLECAKIKEVYGINRPDWRSGLAMIIAEL